MGSTEPPYDVGLCGDPLLKNSISPPNSSKMDARHRASGDSALPEMPVATVGSAGPLALLDTHGDGMSCLLAAAEAAYSRPVIRYCRPDFPALADAHGEPLCVRDRSGR